MREVFSEHNMGKASLGLLFIFIISVYYSLFLISVSMIGLSVFAVIYYLLQRPGIKIQWTPIIFMTLGILPFLLGMAQSTDKSIALRELQHNVGYLFIPFSLLILPPFSKKQLQELISFFILVTCVTTIPVLWTYLNDFEAVNLSLGSGRTLSTPIDHVRYSIFISFAIVFCMICYLKEQDFFIDKSRRIFLILGIYLFLFIHILAVRSGIILTYGACLLVGSMILLQKKKFIFISLLWVIIIGSPILAYFAFPSFQNKIKYTRYDYSLWKQGSGGNYSDSERIRSFHLGTTILKDNPILGTGTGDLRSDIYKLYQTAYEGKGRPMTPHNQFLKVAASSGYLGLLFFVLSIYIPFFWKQNFLDPYILGFVVLISMSFMVEATLERTYMLLFYLAFAAIFYRRVGKLTSKNKS